MTDLELARVIRRLRSYRQRSVYRYRAGSYYGRYEWVPGTRFWTDEEVCEVLHISKTKMDACLKLLGPRQWNRKKVLDVCFKWINKNKRWPTRKDHLDWRNNGLPCHDSVAYHVGRWDLVDLYVRKHWDKLTPQMILTIPNITTRRDAITKYGIEKLLKNGGGTQVQQDDFGILWELPLAEGRDRTSRYVEVINSTPRLNKNGTPIKRKGSFVYDHYFLRVPPDTKTAKDGVAWTFNKTSQEFVGFAAQS